MTRSFGPPYFLGGFQKPEDLQPTIDVFIKNYLLCGTCLLPETTLQPQNDKLIRSCRVCGKDTPVEYQSKISPIILREFHWRKLGEYLMKNYERKICDWYEWVDESSKISFAIFCLRSRKLVVKEVEDQILNFLVLVQALTPE